MRKDVEQGQSKQTSLPGTAVGLCHGPTLVSTVSTVSPAMSLPARDPMSLLPDVLAAARQVDVWLAELSEGLVCWAWVAFAL